MLATGRIAARLRPLPGGDVRLFARAALAALVCSLFAQAQTSNATGSIPSPTTTLAAETGNNTSAADAFATQTDGNLGASNVSKAPTASLLYAGANTRIYAHFMPWFGGANHMNIGYRSDDPVQVRRQVDDMMSRGIAGAIIDWYGPTFTRENNTTLLMKAEAELRGGAFEFAVMEDVGALNSCAHTAGCDVTGKLVSDLTYAANTYYGSPAYMRIAGRPVVFFFGVEQYAIDWTRARAQSPGNPLFIFRNSVGFTHAVTDGAFSWVNPSSDPLNLGLAYIDNFYATGLAQPLLHTFASTYKGFNASLAAWAPNPPRVLAQQCGATWLQTFAEMGKYYSPLNQLEALQLVTWNDYEEGTEIESGIDNCVGVQASLSGTQLNWAVTGSAATLDHFSVFLSTDGSGLALLRDVPASARSLDLATLTLPAGAYQLYVKAVGKPTLLNHMSAAVNYSVTAPVNQPPVAAVSVTPSSAVAPATVTASTAGSS